MRVVAGLAVAAMVALLPLGAQAAIFSSAPAQSESSLTFKTQPGTFTGKWAYRSIAISGDPKAAAAKVVLGTSEFNLIESGGKITGTRPAAAKGGKPYDVTGFVVYGPRKAPQIVLHSTSDVNGKSYEYDYFGYLMPTWNVGAAQPDTFMGTVVRTDPSAPEAPAIVVSFIATRESPTAAGAVTPSAGAPVADKPKPAKPAKPKPAAAPAAPAADAPAADTTAAPGGTN